MNISIFIPFILPIAFGYFISILRVFKDSEVVSLRKFIIQISVPFLIFKSLYKADVSSLEQVYPAVFSFFIITGFFSSFAYLFSKYFGSLFNFDTKLKNTFIFSTFIGNYAFLGWGIINSFYGEQAFTRAVFFTMFFWPVFLFWGFLLLFFRMKDVGKRERVNKRTFILILLNKAAIPVISALIGILMNVFEFEISGILWGFIRDFAALTIPMILFTIGLNFKLKMKISALKIILATSLSRLIIGFILGLITVFLADLFFLIDNLTIKVVLLESIMPTAAMSVFFVDFIEIDRKLMSSIITMTTLLSFLTIPLWYMFIEVIIA